MLARSKVVVDAVELLSSPIAKILDRHFEAEIPKTTLATDAVGSTLESRDTESAYVLLHHAMGESEGLKGMCVLLIFALDA